MRRRRNGGVGGKDQTEENGKQGGIDGGKGKDGEREEGIRS